MESQQRKGRNGTEEFEDLFLREPGIPREVNVDLDKGNLQRLAENIWLEQGFME
ncbi:hypothetical protein KXW99_004510 [Aspergillus fumigatus]|nr:hypothetical protein KXW99_004510 [Aspergillus fumigatus]